MLNENLVKSMEKSLAANWSKLCFSDYGKGGGFTYSEIARMIKELHIVFEICGIKEGDKIALAGKNSTNWAVTYLAAVTYGAVIVPILADFSSDEIHYIVTHSESKLFFAGENIFDRIDEERISEIKAVFNLDTFALFYTPDKNLESKILLAVNDFRKKNKINRKEFVLKDIPNDQIASIVYTSGTTGFSKGVMISHNCLMTNVRFFIDNLPVKEEQRVLSFLPLAHCFGCAFDFLGPFMQGLQIVFLGKIPSPKVILKAFQDVKPYVIFAVPLVLEKVYRSKIMPVLETTKMKILMKTPGINKLIMKKIGKGINDAFGGEHYEIVVGGASFNPEIEDFFLKAGVRVTVGYGMTECGPLISYWDYYKKRPLGSCGKCIEYLEMKIDNPNEKGIGEICVKGENIMNGYFKMEKSTEETIDSEGWLHTGDLGYVDEEGFVYISGRSKNLILSASGQNIYPEEIEAKINNMPYVNESLVLDAGEGKLVAYVYPDKEKMDKNKVTEVDLAMIMEDNRLALNETQPAFA
ncbi:MAG TPA: long-chain fatty acid--CoA ligase, partial [bacterium]|nr:long-chain fatty acid--CoA ligase [bacterium]